MRITPSAVRDCAASSNYRRDMGRGRRGGWFTWPAGAGPEDDVTPNMPQRPIRTSQRRTRCSRNMRLLKDGPPRRSGRVGHPAMAWRCRREKLRRSCGGRVTDGGDNGATGDLGGDGRRWWCRRWGCWGRRRWGQATGEPAHSRRGRRSPSVSRASSGRPAVIDSTRRCSTAKPVSETMPRPLILVLNPDGATRLSLNELADMDGKQFRDRCQFLDEPAVCVHYDSFDVAISEGVAHIACGPPATGTPAVSRYNGGARRGWARASLENREGSPADRARRARSIPPGASPRR